MTKIRTGFVSNSSSSSFIIAVKKDDPKDLVITLPIDEYIGEGESLEDFSKNPHLLNDCDYRKDYIDDLKKECKKYEKTHNFVYLNLDQYEDAILIQALEEKQKDIVVIEGGDF